LAHTVMARCNQRYGHHFSPSTAVMVAIPHQMIGNHNAAFSIGKPKRNQRK
jgi:hypothetical protein